MIYGYLGNPKLRKAFVNISLTQREMDEYRKCAKDRIYFIKKYNIREMLCS